MKYILQLLACTLVLSSAIYAQNVSIDILQDVSALQSNNTSALSSSALSGCVTDYSFNPTIDYLNNIIQLSDVLISSCGNLGNPDIFITDNNDFDNGNLSIAENQFNSSNYSIWYHIYEITCEDEEAQDLLFVKFKQIENPLDCDNEDLIVQNWNFAFPINFSIPNFTYKFTQKSFGPWIDFGHFDLIPCVTNTHDRANSFMGDNRGFSLSDSKQYTGSNPSPTTVYGCNDNDNVTSRIHHSVEFTLGNFTKTCEDVYSSGTLGAKNFIGGGGDQCNWNCEVESEIVGTSTFSVNTLYLHSQGSDKCISLATDIDLRSKLSYDIVNENNKTYLRVRGFLAHKSFPSHEYVLQDLLGKRVFIHTFSAAQESSLVCELFENIYDGFYPFDYKIEVNANTGLFGEEIIFSSLKSNTFFTQPGTGVNPLTGANICNANINVSGDPIEFEYTSWTIDLWNDFYFGSDPAGDCPSVPCEGVLGKCE